MADEKEKAANSGGGEDGAEGQGEDTRPTLTSLMCSDRVKHWPAESEVFKAGDPVECCWYIVLGRVGLFAGGEQIGELMGEEFLGVYEFLLAEERPTYTMTAKTLEDCELMRLSMEALIEVMGRGALKKFARAMSRVLEGTGTVILAQRARHETETGKLRRALQEVQGTLDKREEQLDEYAVKNGQLDAQVKGLQLRVSILEARLRRFEGTSGPSVGVEKVVRDHLKLVIEQIELARQALFQMTSTLPPSLLVELQQNPEFEKLHKLLIGLADECKVLEFII